jgi:GrpB-like predicted nucleotidyltransferase (UPF0157 family)
MHKLKMVNYDENWQEMFEIEKERFQNILKTDLLEIHHIGSTSIPGMSAKPIIDILCVIKKNTKLAKYNKEIENEGYEVRGECLNAIVPGTPGRYYYPKIVKNKHIYHVHICHESHPQIVELLQLKEYLIDHPIEALEYSNLKKELVKLYSENNVEYMKGKDIFIKGLIKKAKAYYDDKNVIKPLL